MSRENATPSAVDATRTNGAGAAALLAAGIGVFLIAAFAIATDQSAGFMRNMIFSKATGPLSGETTCAIVLWLAAWAMLHIRWRPRNVALPRIIAAACVLLLLGLLLTFPPVADLF